MHTQTRKCCLRCCLRCCFVGVMKEEQFSSVYFMDCLRAVRGNQLCGHAGVSATTDPTRGRARPLRCAVEPGACQRFFDCVLSPYRGRDTVARTSPDWRVPVP